MNHILFVFLIFKVKSYVTHSKLEPTTNRLIEGHKLQVPIKTTPLVRNSSSVHHTKLYTHIVIYTLDTLPRCFNQIISKMALGWVFMLNLCLAMMVVLGRMSSAQGLAHRASTRHFEFHVMYANITRLCSTKQVVSVNGQVPGPTLYAREGDNVLIKVAYELPDKNVTIHWQT